MDFRLWGSCVRNWRELLFGKAKTRLVSKASERSVCALRHISMVILFLDPVTKAVNSVLSLTLTMKARSGRSSTRQGSLQILLQKLAMPAVAALEGQIHTVGLVLRRRTGLKVERHFLTARC